jgi:hypothetical protein
MIALLATMCAAQDSQRIGSSWGKAFEARMTHRRDGEQRLCLQNRPHKLSYSTVGAPDEMFVELVASDVKSVNCDLSATSLRVQMADAGTAKAFAAKIEAIKATYGDVYVTGMSCTANRTNPTPSPGPLAPLRRPVNTSSTCNQFTDCWSCLSVPFCNYCPQSEIEGGLACDNSDYYLRTKCHGPSSCIGPPCTTKKCPAEPAPEGQSDYILRRILDYTVDGTDIVSLHAVIVKYDELFSDANMTISRTEGNCSSPDTSQWCLGFNVDNSPTSPTFCKANAGSIPLFHAGPITIDCTNCFVGFEFDFVFNMHIKKFKLQYIEFGFKNIGSFGAMEVTATAEAQWSTMIDKTLSPLPGGEADIDFKIGIIPFHSKIQIPVEVSVAASFDAKVTTTFGSDFVGDYGDNVKIWTINDGWSHTKTTPEIDWTPVFTESKSFNAQLDTSLVPQILYTMDNVFDYTLTFTKGFHADVTWDDKSKQICMSSIATESEVEIANLHINVPWVKMSLTKQWG